MRIKDLTEAQIPFSDYGYWINPMGEAFPVERMGHANAIEELTDGELDMAAAMKAGWARVVAFHKYFNLDGYFERFSIRVLATIKKIVWSYPYSEFEVTDRTHDEENGVEKDFSNPEGVVRYLYSLKMNALSESIASLQR